MKLLLKDFQRFLMNHFVSQTKHWCVKVVAFTKDQLNYG